jgi:hypothetical protein
MTDYFSTYNPDQNYDQIRFLAKRPLQSRELNDLQEQSDYKLKTIGNSLYPEGTFINGHIELVNNTLVLKDCQIYLGGFVRTFSATFPIKNDCTIGVAVHFDNVSLAQDSNLGDPCPGTNHGNPGAERRKYHVYLEEMTSKTPAWVHPLCIIKNNRVFCPRLANLKRLSEQLLYDVVIDIEQEGLNFTRVNQNQTAYLKQK